MFGAPKLGRFRSLASLILVVNVVGELQRKRTLAASRGFLAAARLSCISCHGQINDDDVGGDVSMRLGLVVSMVTSAKPRYYILKQC